MKRKTLQKVCYRLDPMVTSPSTTLSSISQTWNAKKPDEKYGSFLKLWYPQNTPKWEFLVGKPLVVGYHHFRKPPYLSHCLFIFQQMRKTYTYSPPNPPPAQVNLPTKISGLKPSPWTQRFARIQRGWTCVFFGKPRNFKLFFESNFDPFPKNNGEMMIHPWFG